MELTKKNLAWVFFWEILDFYNLNFTYQQQFIKDVLFWSFSVFPTFRNKCCILHP